MHQRISGLLDLHGFTRSEHFVWLVLVMSVLLVVLEAGYNIDLLNTLSNPNADSASVGELSQRGKLLGAFGISWALFRVLLTRIQPAAAGLAAFLAVVFVTYQALDLTYTKVISGLKPEIKVQGFNLFSYRRDILTEKLSDPDIPHPKDAPIIGKILMGAFPIVILDERFMLPAQDIVERKAGDKSKAVMLKAEKAWPEYNRNMRELSQAYGEYLQQSKKAYQYKAWGGINKFRQRSGGMEPNPGATRTQFIATLRASKHPKGAQLRKSEERVIGKRPDGSPVYAKELPYFMERQQYLQWFEAQAKQARESALPTAKSVESFKGIEDVNAAVFLPPMAIITSLTSAMTNAISVLLIFIAMVFAAIPATKSIAQGLKKAATPIMVMILAILLYAMPDHVFAKGTALYDLETTMHQEIGLAGQIWSRLSNLQKLIL